MRLDVLKKSEFVKNVFTIALGTSISQLLTIVSSPILTRLYSPADFGTYSLFVSISSILSVLTTGRYEYSILVAENDEEAWNSVILITKIAVLFSFLVIISGFSVYFLRSRYENFYLNFLWFTLLLAFSLLLNGFFQSFYFWFNRIRHYSKLAKNQIYGSIGVVLASIILGLARMKNSGLILGLIFGQMINTSLLFMSVKKSKKRFYMDWSNLKQHALKYKNYPKFLIISGFLDRISSQLHILLFSSFFGKTITGYIGLYQKVIRVPTNLIGTSIANVFRQKASEHLYSFGECKKLFLKTASTLFVIGIFPFLILLFFSPFLFEIIFGKQWIVAGEYSQIMSWMFLLGFIVSPLSSLIYIGQKQKYDLILQMFLIISTSVSILIGWHLKSVIIALILYTFSYCIKYFIEFVISYKISIKG